MQRIEITYNPYKMETTMLIDGIDVCNTGGVYAQFKEFIEINTPLQTWIEPIPYKNWQGIVNEIKGDEEGFDCLEFHFHGRKIDFEDLRSACITENDNREYKLDLEFIHETVISDEKLAQNVDVIMDSLLSDRFASIVKKQGTESTAYVAYQDLEENYIRAKKKEFKIVFAGLYSSGKSTILNSLIRHNVLPTSDETCTAKTCKIKHNGKLKSSITLECFDKDGNVVVEKEKYNSDEACLKRFWEITPLNSKVSVPENVDVIELCMDLSHLYPSKELEQAFNLVIVDTPGCNSRKKSSKEEPSAEKVQNELNDIALVNTDKKLALDAITNGDREMIIICADAQDYDDESLGDFLKAIYDAVEEDNGDFNDRFLFVLNKCDLKKYRNDESVLISKNGFAEYLMDTERWGINQNSFEFVPRVFMTSAYNYFALMQGADQFQIDEIKDDKEKRNLYRSYKDFNEQIIMWQDENYYLSQVCDVPDSRKREYEKDFETSIQDNEKHAVELQTGMCCIEDAIRDYIARYAYPLKVQDLIETFDLLLDSVRDYSAIQAEILQERINNMGKSITEREEVAKQQKAEEEKETALQKVREKVEKEKGKIAEISLDMSRLQKIRGDMFIKIETDPSVVSVRSAQKKIKLTESKLISMVTDIDNMFSEAWQEVDKAFSDISLEYKEKIHDICESLNEIASELKKYNIYGYSFSSSLALKRIELRNAKSLVKDIQKTKEIKSKQVTKTVRNPIKDIEYRKIQIFKRIGQFFASDTIEKTVTIMWDEYDLTTLNTYITNNHDAFNKLTNDAETAYASEIEKMKENASDMADDVVTDIQSIIENITVYKNKLTSLGDNIAMLKNEIESSKATVNWLSDLICRINEGGRVSE